MAKQIVYGDQELQAVLRGINQLADAADVVRDDPPANLLEFRSHAI